MTDHNNNGAENEWMELVKTAFWAVLLAITIRTTLYEPFNIPSGSMKPTLEIGDYLFVSKFAYGYSRYSIPFAPDIIEGRVWDTPPERGDVVVFKLPSDNKTDYIKRIIGMPGDTVQVRSGRLYINGNLVERRRIGEVIETDHYGDSNRVTTYEETLPNGVTYRIYEESDHGALDNTDVFTVPANHYFAMGDNRDNSQDSRVAGLVGTVPYENIVGRAERIFFSTNGNARLWEFWKWPWTVRYDRIMDAIR